MTIQARVLIVARDDEAAGPLSEGLDRLGWRTVTARGPYAAMTALADLPIEAAIIDLASMSEDPILFAKKIKMAASPRRVPLVAIGEPNAHLKTVFDLILSAPLHPAQAALRLESLVRMAVAEEEFELRLATFSERGRRLDSIETDAAAYRILAIGEPAPNFLALSNTLSRLGAEVVGSFTAYTAFDYLHERPFDAVVLWSGENSSEALSIAAGMRRNSRLYHIPTMLYLSEDSAVGVTEAYNRGVTDVASPAAPEAETANRVIELARSYRRQTGIRNALERARASGLMDVSTGLFTRDLFAAHLARLATAARERDRPLAVGVLRVSDTPEVTRARAGGWLDKAAPQIGSMIGRLIRVEDTAARLGPDIFAIALPATLAHAGRSAVERVAAVIACTAFEAGEGQQPFVVNFDIGVTGVEPGENPAKALERAANKSMQKVAG